MIYQASYEDLGKILEFALRIPEDLGFEHLPNVNPYKVSEFIMKKWQETPILVYKDETGEILGMVGLSIDKYWWSDENMLVDYMFYVVPEHRKGKVVKELIKAMRDMGRVNNLPVLSHFMSYDRTQAKERLFKDQDFNISGFIATYGI
jgi:hypothetical protein